MSTLRAPFPGGRPTRRAVRRARRNQSLVVSAPADSGERSLLLEGFPATSTAEAWPSPPSAIVGTSSWPWPGGWSPGRCSTPTST